MRQSQFIAGTEFGPNSHGCGIVGRRQSLPTDPVRSELMKRVRRSRSDIEESVGRLLRELGIAYRRNVRSLPGSPDFANKRRKWAIFVNGCFWHAHRNCRLGTQPSRNAEFWSSKFADNRKRDSQKIRALRSQGFKVLVIWQCQIGHPKLSWRIQNSLNLEA
jgi:DNA mismatch endonuclease (patch repair protein)